MYGLVGQYNHPRLELELSHRLTCLSRSFNRLSSRPIREIHVLHKLELVVTLSEFVHELLEAELELLFQELNAQLRLRERLVQFNQLRTQLKSDAAEFLTQLYLGASLNITEWILSISVTISYHELPTSQSLYIHRIAILLALTMLSEVSLLRVEYRSCIALATFFK